MTHGDPVISGAGDNIPDRPDSYKGPRCGYTVREKKDGIETRKKCDSPEVVWNITGRTPHGIQRETPVCGPHLPKAWKEWNVGRADKVKP